MQRPSPHFRMKERDEARRIAANVANLRAK
jgi:hypothetical protein